MTQQTGGPTEHRFAVVMNGGVSLAVWMGGVAYELDNLRRASLGLPVPEAKAEPVYDRWAAACRERGLTVTVDVIAGTSAGGLNGVLLAAAIARGASLSGLRDLWLDAGQIATDKLLTPQTDGTRSVLNGDFFHEHIERAVTAMTPTEHARDVDLTVTSTALSGNSRRVYDSLGRPFSEADHRRRYRFRRTARTITYAPGPRGGTFDPAEGIDEFTTSEPLATAARASASFPAAFAPVLESPELAAQRSWPPWPPGSGLTWLADGGILDNSPFEPVLDAIAAQPVSVPWQRTLCYVVPSAEEAALGRDLIAESRAAPRPATGGTARPDPPPWTAVVTAAFGLPSEADFRDDIEQLDRSLSGGRASLDLARFRGLLDPGAQEAIREARTISTTGMALYRQVQAASAVYDLRTLIAASRPTGYLAPTAEVDPTPIAAAEHPWLPERFPVTSSASWHWGVGAAGRVTRLMLRSLREESLAYNDLRGSLGDHVAKIEAIGRALEGRLRATPAPTTGPLPAQQAAEILDAAYDALRIPEALAQVVNDASRTFADGWLDDAGRADGVLLAALCVEVTNGIAGTPAAPMSGPIFDFARIGISQAPRLLAQAYAEAEEQARSSGSARAVQANDILYGTRLNHFASFGRAEWRSWDWMWGRLHAVTQFGDVLGLSVDEIDALTEAVLATEGETADSVGARIPQVLTMSPAQLLDQLRADHVLAPALDSVFALLRSEARTAPPVPPPVSAGGGWASALLARTPGSITLGRRCVRWAVSLIGLRRKLWRRVGD